MRVEICDIKNNVTWYNLLERLDEYQKDVYYYPDYYSVYQGCGLGKALSFCFEYNGQHAVYPFLFNRVESAVIPEGTEYYDIQGAYGYNGVVYSTKEEWFTSAFYGAFCDYCKESNIIAEFTRFHPLLGNHRFSVNFVDIYFDRKNVLIDLSNSLQDIVRNSFNQDTRQKIKRAENEGYIYYESNEISDVEQFRKLYYDTMNRVNAHEYYHFPMDYFHGLTQLSPEKSSFHFVKNREGFLLSAICLLHSPFYATYHLGARQTVVKEQFGHTYLIYSIIRQLKVRGLRYLILGGSSSGSANDSLLDFKMKFSKELIDFSVGKRIHNRELYFEIVNNWRKSRPEHFRANKHLLLGYNNV